MKPKTTQYELQASDWQELYEQSYDEAFSYYHKHADERWPEIAHFISKYKISGVPCDTSISGFETIMDEKQIDDETFVTRILHHLAENRIAFMSRREVYSFLKFHYLYMRCVLIIKLAEVNKVKIKQIDMKQPR